MTGNVTGSLSPYIIYLGLLTGILAIVLLVYVGLRRRSLKTLFLQEPWFDGPSRSFYGLLDVAVKEHFSLFRNVAVDDVIRFSGSVSPLPRAIQNGFFDILLCDRRKMDPQCGIILVDKKDLDSRKTQRLRDFCDRVNLPLLVYETGRMLEVSKLRNDVYKAAGLGDKLGTCEVLGGARGVEGSDSDKKAQCKQDTGEVSSRSCAKCGGTMTLRTISKGQHAGKKAWICGKYPECRHAILEKNQVAV